MLIGGWNEEKRRDQLLQSRSIVLSTIDDAGQSMIGNINKRDRRKKKKLSSFLLFFFLSSSAVCNRDTVLESCGRFVGIRSVRLLCTPILHLGQRDVSSMVDESTRKRTRFTHVTATLRGCFFFFHFDLAPRSVAWCIGIRSAAFSSCDLASRR